MAQKGIKVHLKLAPKTKASGAGSAATTLNVRDKIFLTDFATEAISVGGNATTISSVTDSDTVVLAAGQTWADGADVKLTKKKITGQKVTGIQRGAEVIDITTKDDNQIRRILAGLRSGSIESSGLYTDNDNSWLYLIMAAKAGAFVEWELTDEESTAHDRSGSGLITRLTLAHPMENVVRVDTTVLISGAVTTA